MVTVASTVTLVVLAEWVAGVLRIKAAGGVIGAGATAPRCCYSVQKAMAAAVCSHVLVCDHYSTWVPILGSSSVALWGQSKYVCLRYYLGGRQLAATGKCRWRGLYCQGRYSVD